MLPAYPGMYKNKWSVMMKSGLITSRTSCYEAEFSE